FEALQQTAIETHPELERLQAQLAAQRAEVGLANKNFYPDFQLSTGYNSLWEEEDKRWSVGVSINIPWNRSKYRSLLDAAQAEAMRARWQLVDRRAELLAELVRTRAELVESSEVIELYQERLVPLARDNLDAALADYRAGAGDFLEVITAETKKLMTELRLARARADYLRRLAALERWSNRGLGVDAAARNIRQPFEELTVGGSAAGAEVKDNEIE
ncbi:MAG: TolC family protein, partial [Nitrococcus mobilis]|nr:TolC family protein [Nitrococcus mobilis]